ncbi:MAG: alkaline phosphatase D family protein [Bacteroidia bacterium]|nr:alkaline phosphatase D family protein [Bacteroidia bacterium]
MKFKFFFPFLFIALFFISCSSQNTNEKTEEQKKIPYPHHGLSSYYNKDLAPFYHGVASGDPLPTAVIIWTKISPDFYSKVKVNVQVALDEKFSQIVQNKDVEADSSNDYILKIDIQDLKPGTFYYYRFSALGKWSPVGRTKTLADGRTENVRLAFASCSNYAWGFFNPYRLMADDTLDAVVHLGDYIYEHSQTTYNNSSLNRKHLPDKEIVSLEDYRTRYAQYRLDNDLQAVHSKHPFIVIWDDHEFANNAYVNGAGNHQPDEGDWQTRLDAARKAYYEWMPVREQNNKQLYRAFSFGDLVNLIMLDTRVEGRTVQVKGKSDLNYNDTNRKIISTEQFNWVADQLKSNKGQWKIIGNQVLFADMLCFFGKKGELYMDGWSGYPYQKKKFAELVSAARNVAIVTGDFHSSFVYNNPRPDSDKGIQLPTIPEFIVPSITSANYDEEYTIPQTNEFEKMYLKQNKDLAWTDLNSHGYLLLKCDGKNMTAVFKFAETILKPSANKKADIVFTWDGIKWIK